MIAEQLGILLTFPSGARCHGCLTNGELATFKRCSGCSTVLYCSQNCQTLDWKGRMIRANEPHKKWCSIFKGHMAHLGAVQSVIKSFPWGRVEADGTFFHDLACARFKVLGGTGLGFWSQSGLGLLEEDDDSQLIKDRKMQFADFEWVRSWEKTKEVHRGNKFIDGHDLLKEKHWSDDEGWKLPADCVVRRDFSRAQTPSRASLVRNWDDWHTWRKIPKSSIASLLMHYPMTIYWMLTKILNVASVGLKESHAHLTVHYIGAEVELNFIPIFSELALLLPHHDLDIVFFGPCVFHIGREGLKDEHRSSLISSAVHDRNAAIFTYNAPEVCGSGRVRVFLHTAAKYWTVDDLLKYGRKPDAILACNAGLFTYDASESVVRASLRYKIPFAVTDYQQYMLESNSSTISQLTYPRIPPEPVQLNPFHRPGQRHIPRDNFAPNLDNGFILVVYKPTS
ncbi:hypothetical protein C8J57DRAFT_1087093 [Mycena rebaudengoi]|nr:hypothetical protein C8J57DRAFT_1087093 [Mycena rebaudengoi]